MFDFIVKQWWLVAAVTGSLIPLILRFARRGFVNALQELDRKRVQLEQQFVSTSRQGEGPGLV